MPGILDALLGPADPLGHGGFRHQERVGDLRGRETAHRAKRQSDGRRRRESGMAAHEQAGSRVSSLPAPLSSAAPGRRFCRRQLPPPTPLRAGVAQGRSEAGRSCGGRPRGSASRAGCPGVPSLGHCRAAAINASWTASSAAGKLPKRRITAPSTCGTRSRRRLSRLERLASHVQTSPLMPSITGRTSMGRFAGAPPAPEGYDSRAAISRARFGLSTSTIQKPGQELLCLREGAVSDHGRAVPFCPHDLHALRARPGRCG